MSSTTQHFFKSRNLRLRNQYSIPINTIVSLKLCPKLRITSLTRYTTLPQPPRLVSHGHVLHLHACRRGRRRSCCRSPLPPPGCRRCTQDSSTATAAARRSLHWCRLTCPYSRLLWTNGDPSCGNDQPSCLRCVGRIGFAPYSLSSMKLLSGQFVSSHNKKVRCTWMKMFTFNVICTLPLATWSLPASY
jgi:hypothetical protein